MFFIYRRKDLQHYRSEPDDGCLEEAEDSAIGSEAAELARPDTG